MNSNETNINELDTENTNNASEHTHNLEDDTILTHIHNDSETVATDTTIDDLTHDNSHAHTHDNSHAHTHEHSHNHELDHAHAHPHHHENTKAVLNRMSRAIGHMESIKRMVEDGRDCSEVLIQIAAVRSAINNIGKIILEDHINHCIVDAVETGDKKALEDLNEAIEKFVK